MTYVTRKGTKVLDARAARMAITHETYWNSAEYRTYRDVYVHGEHFAAPGDPLYVAPNEDRPEWAFATNLTTGESRTLDWDALAHTAKPAEAVA